MTDSQAEQPFDPDAAGRVAAFLDGLDDPEHTQGAISTLRSEGLRLTAADLREVLRQRAYAKDEAVLLAEKCAAWRGQYEDARSKLEAVCSWTRSRLEALSEAQRDWRQSSENAGKVAILDDLTRVLDHLDTPVPAETESENGDTPA